MTFQPKIRFTASNRYHITRGVATGRYLGDKKLISFLETVKVNFAHGVLICFDWNEEDLPNF